MKLVFMGTPDFAVPSLDRLAACGHEIAAVVTRPDRPRGRGRKLAPTPVKTAAHRLGLPVMQPRSLQATDFLDRLRRFNADLFVVVAFVILPRVVLKIPALGSVNLHPSLLPKYRGAAPINWAIIRGETETGISVFRLSGRVDAGDLLFQQVVGIGPDETAGELSDRLRMLGADALAGVVEGLERDELASKPQPDAGVTRAPRLEKEDGRIDWTRGAAPIRNLVRGTNPYPGAFTTWRGEYLKVHRASVAGGAGLPGEVVVADGRKGCVIAAGEGTVALEEVQPAGKGRMTGAELVRGYRIESGEIFGDAIRNRQ
ncbi:MAG: methionyl-tRNA formyltransferase [Gemmatimonadota bacterium]|nr:methionyl-tRNA formyltransferase [Gemmatimonadota bacterium]